VSAYIFNLLWSSTGGGGFYILTLPFIIHLLYIS